MLKGRSRAKDLKPLINTYVLIHVSNLMITGVDGEMGMGYLSGIEGFVVKVTESYLYLSDKRDGMPNMMVNVDQILVITAVPIEEKSNEFKVITMDKEK